MNTKIMDRLLNSYDSHKFFEEYWTEKALLISGNGRRNFSDLFSWSKLNYLLNFTDLDDSDIHLIVGGKLKPVKEFKTNEVLAQIRVMQLLQKGATLRLNSIHTRVPEIAEFVSELGYEIGYNRINVNMYCSWPNQVGSTSHYDPRDVFILQIEGSKKWNIFQPTIKYPIAQESALDTPPKDPYLTCTLEPGDVLYIPRGHWHYPIGTDRESVHLTIGIKVAAGIDLMEWLLNELRHKEEWRKSFPVKINTSSQDIEKSIQNLMGQLVDYISERDIPSDFIDYTMGLERSNRYSLPYQVGLNILPDGIDTVFRRDKWLRTRISVINENEFLIKVGAKDINLQGVPHSFVKNLFTEDSFTANDIWQWSLGLDWESDIIPIITHLVMEGIIFVEHSEDN
ncbi:hypothetical protein BCD67_03065 [Oscillatoriales cyanobacterium USR001]|nr:hypothetical protein BCD67_03065 [Oscillatoriales cyanobacterium USR001]